MIPTSTKFQEAIQKDGRLALWAFKPFAKFDLPQHIKASSEYPTLLAGNHRSLLDVFAAAATCYEAGTSARFLVNARYFKTNLIGSWLRRIGCIPLSRGTKEEAFKEATKALERNELVGIMPEGRLFTPDQWQGHVGPAKPGVSELALRTGARIVPIAFHNTERVWPKDKWPRLAIKRPTVTMRFGRAEALPYQEHQKNADHVMKRLNDILAEIDSRSKLLASSK